MADVPIAGPEGIVRVDEHSLSADELSTIGRHMNAITRYRDRGEADSLEEFEGVVIAGVPLVTEPDRIDELDEDDRLDFEQFYE